jgi:hypothetical protein
MVKINTTNELQEMPLTELRKHLKEVESEAGHDTDWIDITGHRRKGRTKAKHIEAILNMYGYIHAKNDGGIRFIGELVENPAFPDPTKDDDFQEIKESVPEPIKPVIKDMCPPLGETIDIDPMNNEYNDIEFLYWCYRHILVREPDPNGLDNWTKHLKIGMPRDRVVRSFNHSQEYIRKFGKPDEPANE